MAATSRRLVLALVLVSLPGPLLADDTLLLDNGDRITGTFIRLADGELTFRADVIGETFRVAVAEIAGLETDQALTVRIADGDAITGRAAGVDGGTLRLVNDSFDTPAEVPLEAVVSATSANTPVEPAVRTSGDFSVGAQLTQGNTRSRSVSAGMRMTLRTESERLRMDAEFNRAQEDGEETVDNAAGGMRYDHFVSRRLFLNTNVGLSRDPFRDLRLRSTFGTGLGYQFLETQALSLSTETGLSYVREERIDSPDEENPAIRWAMDYEQAFGAGRPELFHSQEGLLNVDDFGELLLRTRTGIRFPFFGGITGTVQVNFDYDSEPTEATRNTDLAYIIKGGYNW